MALFLKVAANFFVAFSQVSIFGLQSIQVLTELFGAPVLNAISFTENPLARRLRTFFLTLHYRTVVQKSTGGED